MSCIVKAEAKILSRANKQLSAVEICWPCPSAKRGSPKCFPAWSSCCCLFPSEGVLCWCFAAADEEKAAPKRKTKGCSLIASVMRKKKKRRPGAKHRILAYCGTNGAGCGRPSRDWSNPSWEELVVSGGQAAAALLATGQVCFSLKREKIWARAFSRQKSQYVTLFLLMFAILNQLKL